MPKTIHASWYDYPRFYDLAFRSETRSEADFIEAVCRKYCPWPARRLLEPGCGSGRLVFELARRGYEMIGFDRNPAALTYLRQRLQRAKLDARILREDLERFDLGRPPRIDAVFCTLNTFRHLLKEADAQSHLHCVAKCLRPGGIYVLGFHLLPLDAAEEDCERWTETMGDTRVTATLRVLNFDRRRRLERLRLSLRVRSTARDFRIRSEFSFRLYTRRQFLRTLAGVPELRLRDVYDFCYEIDRPVVLNEERTDTVFVLQRRREWREPFRMSSLA